MVYLRSFQFFKHFNHFQTMQEHNEIQLMNALGNLINNQVASINKQQEIFYRTGLSLDNQVIMINLLTEINKTLKNIESNQSKLLKSL